LAGSPAFVSRGEVEIGRKPMKRQENCRRVEVAGSGNAESVAGLELSETDRYAPWASAAGRPCGRAGAEAQGRPARMGRV
jgi:hypothetical protein